MVIAEATRAQTSINPSDFKGTEKEELLKRSCEGVVDLKAGEEAKRTARERDDKECEVRVAYRVVHTDLLTALDTLADVKGRSRTLIEKCLIHQGKEILLTVPFIKKANEQYLEILRLNGAKGGLGDIVEQMKASPYRPLKEKANVGSFYGARKTVSGVTGLGVGLGVSGSLMVAIALMLSLTTTEDENLVGVVRDLMPEVEQFLLFAEERAYLMDGYWKMAQSRLSHIQNGNCMSWQHTKGLLWTTVTY